MKQKEKLPTSFNNSRRALLRSEEHTSELQSPCNLVCRLLLPAVSMVLPSFPTRRSSDLAIAVMLLIGAGLLVRSLIALQQVDPGFDANQVLTLQINLPQQKYEAEGKAANFFQQLETRVA